MLSFDFVAYIILELSSGEFLLFAPSLSFCQWSFGGMLDMLDGWDGEKKVENNNIVA